MTCFPLALVRVSERQRGFGQGQDLAGMCFEFTFFRSPMYVACHSLS